MSQIIVDPEFLTLGDKNSRWTLQAHQGVAITAFVDSALLRLEIENTSGSSWHGELSYAPFPVCVGDIFTVSFSARSLHPHPFSVWLGQRDSPFLSLVPENNQFGEKTMTPDWQTFSHIWKPHMDERLARLNFVLGKIDNVVEIANIELKNRSL
jgi:hypothetical protein